MADVPMTLEAHDAKSDARAQEIIDRIDHKYGKLKDKIKETQMETPNIFAMPGAGTGGAMGAGLGGGLLGGVLGGALLGRRGLLGGDGDGWRGNPATVENVQNTVDTAAIMGQLADVKASVPLAEGQVQLALSGAQMNITNAVNSSTASIIAAAGSGFAGVMAGQNMATQMNQKGFADNQAATVAAGNANMIATKDLAALTERNSWAITQAINADGAQTRALIQSIDKTNDSRLITSLSNEITELRGDSRLNARTREVEVNVSQNVNQAQAQAQQQQQYQVLNERLGRILDAHQNLQQGIVNLGTMTGQAGQQTAANTRVN